MKAKIAIIVIVLVVAIVAVLLVTDVIVITKTVEKTEESITTEEEGREVEPTKEEKAPVESVSGELGLSNIVFCSRRPNGYMDYEEQPDATFEPGDVVWVYYNLDGVKYNINQDDTKEVWLKLHLTLKSPEGVVLLDEDLYNEHKNFGEEYNLEELFLRVNINTTEELSEGKYIAESTLRDELADKDATASTSFWLKK
jgi:flagellar basal body-associated protein FliL